MKRYIGIDFGLKRIGLAISDGMGKVAMPLITVPTSYQLDKTVLELIKTLKQYEPIKEIIIGLPLLLSGKDSDMTQTVRNFAALLEKEWQVPIHLWDERLSSLQAERLLKEQSFSRKKRTNKLDQLSAMLILQSYLDSINKKI